MFQNLFDRLALLLGIYCCAASDDYLVGMATVKTQSPGLVQRGKCGSTSAFKNLLASFHFPFNDSICGEKSVDVIFTRTTPVSDTNYDDLPIGSLCIYLPISSTAVSDAQLFILRTDGWEHVDTHREAEATITAAQLLALHTTAQTLVAAPGSGKINVVEGPIMFQTGTQTVAYGAIASGDDLCVGYGGATAGVNLIATLETTGYLDQTTVKGAAINPNASHMTPANTAIQAKLIGAITTGDMTLKVRVRYRTYSSTW